MRLLTLRVPNHHRRTSHPSPYTLGVLRVVAAPRSVSLKIGGSSPTSRALDEIMVLITKVTVIVTVTVDFRARQNVSRSVGTKTN